MHGAIAALKDPRTKAVSPSKTRANGSEAEGDPQGSELVARKRRQRSNSAAANGAIKSTDPAPGAKFVAKQSASGSPVATNAGVRKMTTSKVAQAQAQGRAERAGGSKRAHTAPAPERAAERTRSQSASPNRKEARISTAGSTVVTVRSASSSKPKESPPRRSALASSSSAPGAAAATATAAAAARKRWNTSLNELKRASAAIDQQMGERKTAHDSELSAVRSSHAAEQRVARQRLQQSWSQQHLAEERTRSDRTQQVQARLLTANEQRDRAIAQRAQTASRASRINLAAPRSATGPVIVHYAML